MLNGMTRIATMVFDVALKEKWTHGSLQSCLSQLDHLFEAGGHGVGISPSHARVVPHWASLCCILIFMNLQPRGVVHIASRATFPFQSWHYCPQTIWCFSCNSRCFGGDLLNLQCCRQATVVPVGYTHSSQLAWSMLRSAIMPCLNGVFPCRSWTSSRLPSTAWV